MTVPKITDSAIVRNRNLPAVIQINESRNEPILSLDIPSEERQVKQVTNPEEFDDSDSWPSLPDFTNFNDIYNNHSKGVSKEQIKTLPIRAFGKK